MIPRTLALSAAILLCMAQAGDKRIAWVNVPGYIPDDTVYGYHLRIPRHEHNRAVLAQAFDAQDGLEVSRSGPYDLDGESPSLRTYRWRLPAGEYELRGTLWDRQGRMYATRAAVTVYSTRPGP